MSCAWYTRDVRFSSSRDSIEQLKLFQKLYEKARKVTGEGGDVTSLMEELNELEARLLVEVGQVSRYSAGELDGVLMGMTSSSAGVSESYGRIGARYVCQYLVESIWL